jgi:hypothetical protein
MQIVQQFQALFAQLSFNKKLIFDLIAFGICQREKLAPSLAPPDIYSNEIFAESAA